MKEEITKKLQSVEALASQLEEEVLRQQPCPMYAVLKIIDEGRTVRLAGNSEGLIFIACRLLSLALQQREDELLELGEGEVLDEADRNLVLAFQKADWQR